MRRSVERCSRPAVWSGCCRLDSTKTTRFMWETWSTTACDLTGEICHAGSPHSIMKWRSTMDHPADYAEHAIRNLERAEKLTGVERDVKLKEAEVWARLAQAAAVLRAAQIQSGKK